MQLRAVIAASMATVPSLLVDVLGLSGAGAIVYGVELVSRPAAFVIGGIMLLIAAVILARR